MHAVRPLSRFVAGPAARRTILLDEIDTILGPNAGEHKEQRPGVGGSAPASVGFCLGVAYVLVKVAKDARLRLVRADMGHAARDPRGLDIPLAPSLGQARHLRVHGPDRRRHVRDLTRHRRAGPALADDRDGDDVLE